MTIVYDKLMALQVPPAEQSYGPKDCILYALGIGLGHDPMNEDELAFVYEKNLKVLPTMGTVLGHPGFWVRERDTGIDWVRIVNGEQGIILHRPLAAKGTVVGRLRIIEVIDKGPDKGALVLSERKVTDKATGESVATVTHILPRRWRIRRAAATSARAAPDAHPRSGCGLRFRHAHGSGINLSFERRPQSAAYRSGGSKTGGLSTADHAWPRQFRHCRPCGAAHVLRL
jgi:hypothetical protein